MTRINTNVPSLRGLRNLQRSNQLLETSLERLSTGLRINSGKDNPAGLIASEKLRSQISAIEQSIQNSNRANNVIATADAALGEISSLLNQVRSLIQEGLNQGALSREEIEANQLQIDNALSAINRIAANTTFAGEKLIDGSKAFITQMSSSDSSKLSDYQINQALFGSSSSIEITAQVNQTAQRGELIYTGGELSSAATIEVSGKDGSQVLFLGASSSVTDISNAINSVSDVTGVEAVHTAGATLSMTGSNNDINISDIRPEGSAGTISIELVDPGSNNAALAVSTTTTGDDVKITVSLATDASGNITSTAADVIDALNTNSATKNLVHATAAEDGSDGVVTAVAETDLTGTDGQALRIRSLDYGSTAFVDINVLSGSFQTVAAGSDTAAYRDEGRDIEVTINGQEADTSGLKASIRTALLDVMVEFDTSANEEDTTATITVTGGGALFQIGQEVSASGQIGIGIEAVNTARLGGSSGKLYELASGGGKSLLDALDSNSVQGSDLVQIVEDAINRVATLRGRLGAIQKNVIESNINSLGVALENVTEARSAIIDTDFAVETANMTRAQILQQAGISVLAIANQSPSNVLSLLR